MRVTGRVRSAMLLAGSVLLIMAATTMPWSYVGHAHWAGVEWVPFSRRIRPGDFVLNVLLFVPFGAAAMGASTSGRSPLSSTWRPHRATVIVAGALLSAAVELFQVYCHGRAPTTSDLLANTAGTWLGAQWAQRRAGGWTPTA